MRSLCVSQQAIGAYLGFDEAKGLTTAIAASSSGPTGFDRDRRAKPASGTDPTADDVILDVGQLPRTDGASGDRRKTERRAAIGERPNVLAPAQPERRRGDRRKGQRRTPTTKTGLTGLGSLAVLALFRLPQNVISRLDLLESPGGFGVARIGVGMGFLDEPPMGAFHRREIGVVLQLQRIERPHLVAVRRAVAGARPFPLC